MDYTTMSGGGANPRKLILIGLVLRILLLLSTMLAIVAMTHFKQTEVIRDPSTRSLESRTAKFSHSPALIYFVSAISVVLSYSATTIIQTLCMLRKSCSQTKLVYYHGLFDALMLGIIASATGAAGAVAYIGYKGNDHAGWMEVCSVYGKFCNHVARSVALSLFASVLLLFLVMLSMCTAHKRQQGGR